MGNTLSEAFEKKQNNNQIKIKQLDQDARIISKFTSKKTTITARNNLIDEPLITNFHRSKDPFKLAQIFCYFTKDPFRYFRNVEIVRQISQCCDEKLVRTELFHYKKISLDNLLAIKRMKHLKFAQSEIWYLIKSSVQIFAYMSSKGLPYGSVNPTRFFLREGKFFKIDVLHFLESRQHCCQLRSKNYYSPQYMKCFVEFKQKYCGEQNNKILNKIDIFRSQVFSFGLLLLEITTCPEPHPKFHQYNFKQFLWAQVYKRLNSAQQFYSEKLIWIISLMLREQSLLRPDWNYLSMWLRKEIENGKIDIAPCIFWSI